MSFLNQLLRPKRSCDSSVSPTDSSRSQMILSLFAAALFGGLCASEATAAERPNILICMADDASFPYCGAYGCDWVTTPGFDRIARQGLLFTNAYTPNAKCAPSRSCFLTGRNSWQLKAAANHWCYFPPEFKTYPEALMDAGYFVGETGKDWSPGVALDIDGNRRALVGQAFQERKVKPPAKHMSNNDYAGNFEDFLNSAPDAQPWCFWYGSIEPHRPYETGISQQQGWPTPSDIDRVPGYWPDTESVRIDMLDYAFELNYFDKQLERMLDRLESTGQLENTIVIVTADNGMPFPRVKGQSYSASNHLPLAVMWPKGIAAPGRTVDQLVSFVDIAPTLLDLAGIEWSDSGMQPTAGSSLRSIFENTSQTSTRDFVLIGKERHDIGRPNDIGYPMRGIVQGNYLLVQNYDPTRWPSGNPVSGYLNTDGSPTKSLILDQRRSGETTKFWELCFGKRPSTEFYDLSQDPDCLVNLAESSEYQEDLARLNDVLQTQLLNERDPRKLGNGTVFDTYEYANPSERGFYNRFTAGEALKAGWVNKTDFESSDLEKDP